MQWRIVLVALLSLPSFLLAAATKYGPNNCIWIDQSQTGSCLVRTRCTGEDTTRTDFAFDCVTSERRVRHSFGIGTFDDNENYDTEVICGQCAGPGDTASSSMRGSTAQPVVALKAIAGSEYDMGQGDASNGKTKYGPENCVSIWRDDKSGQCMMQTECAATVDLNSYDFGFLCEDENNKATRHLFGKDSFAHQETFNTLLSCQQCLALDKSTAADSRITKAPAARVVATSGSSVEVLAEDMNDMRQDMDFMKASITRLNGAVFAPQAPAQVAPAQVAPAQVASTQQAAATTGPPPVVQGLIVARKAKHLEVSVRNIGKLKRYTEDQQSDDEQDAGADDEDSDQNADKSPVDDDSSAEDNGDE